MSYSREPSNSKVIRQESVWMLDAAELEDKLDRERQRRKSIRRSIRRNQGNDNKVEKEGDDNADVIETVIDDN